MSDRRSQTGSEVSDRIDTSVEGNHLLDFEVLRPSTCSDSRLFYTHAGMEEDGCTLVEEGRWGRRRPLLPLLLEEAEDPLNLEHRSLSFASSSELHR